MSTAEPTAPATPEALAAVFRRVLEREDVTADSDFFDLGGDSLVATRVLSAVARFHGVELTFDDFLFAPTPARLARRIAAAA
ncbi:acyl carrier protein [Kitasatospora sp. NPDC094011]|uniref:acyl carrier protein n=1 Tax=Kitasatospora sp. NPDC094011 TaxID=3364090 RepID=UPI00382EA77F